MNKERKGPLKMIVSGILVIAIAVVGMSFITSAKQNDSAINQSVDNSRPNKVRISLDEWIGWSSLLYANGGLSTKPDSINARNGISVEYVIMNDAVVSSDALISNSIQGAGYTINRYAFLQSKFDNAGVQVIMPYITNYSNGADGIIAKANIMSVNDLVGKSIAVPKFSEAQTLVEWLLMNSSLTDGEKKEIRDKMVLMDTADETAEAFFAGKVDAAATWEPYLTNAETSSNSRILFDTSMGTNLILDGLLFRQDFIDENEEFVVKLIDGALEANSMYMREFKSVKVMPMFELSTDEEIEDMAKLAKVATCADNISILDTTAVSIYKQMANIWLTVGEEASPNKAETAFTSKYVNLLADKYPMSDITSFSFSAEGRQAAQQISNNSALISVRLDIKFETDSYRISEESFEDLKSFAETAKILNGVYIQIEGNTAKVPGDDGKDFSYKRARSVAKFLQALGINTNRFVIIGNGDTKPIADNFTEEGKAQNRRTEVFFKVVGY